MKNAETNHKTQIAVIGCGRQAGGLVHDLCRFGRQFFDGLILIDRDLKQIRKLAARVSAALKKDGIAIPPYISKHVDATKLSDLKRAIRNCRLVVSSSHYSINPIVAQAAVDVGVNFADLGGYLESSLKIQRLDTAAKKRGVFLAPDLGLAPGLSNILAGWGLRHMQPGMDLAIYCGGLPERPVGPLNYKIVFAVEGLWGTNFGHTVILRNGKPTKVKTLTEVELMDFEPLGKLEAFITNGALATAPWTLQGKVGNYIYKTLRYPGYTEHLRFLEAMGFADQKPRFLDGGRVIPRELLGRLFEEKLAYPQIPDVMALRVTVRGISKVSGKTEFVAFDIFDRADSRLGFSSMERTTGYPASIVIQMLLQRQPSGFVLLEEAVDTDAFILELDKRDIKTTSRAILPESIEK